MRTYKLIVAYDGTHYKGWQKQQNLDQTIQGILERTISDLFGFEVKIDGSGRTDAGVHAKGQTASVVLPGKVPEGFFTEQVNRFLPQDIRITDECLAKNGFHARKSAVGKKYEYFIDTNEKADVFNRKYYFHFPEKLNLKEMQSGADILTGTHEFAGFTDKKDEKSTKRTIYDIIISEHEGRVRIEYIGTGFLYHMVRILTGTLLEVGIHRRTADSISTVLRSGNRSEAGFLAPAKGLFLTEVYYKKRGDR